MKKNIYIVHIIDFEKLGKEIGEQLFSATTQTFFKQWWLYWSFQHSESLNFDVKNHVKDTIAIKFLTFNKSGRVIVWLILSDIKSDQMHYYLNKLVHINYFKLLYYLNIKHIFMLKATISLSEEKWDNIVISSLKSGIRYKKNKCIKYYEKHTELDYKIMFIVKLKYFLHKQLKFSVLP